MNVCSGRFCFRVSGLLNGVLAGLILFSLIQLGFISGQVHASGNQGGLYLVGTGTGDPDNITVRAQRIIAEADILFAMHPDRVMKQYGELIQAGKILDAGHGLFSDRARRGDPERLRELEEQARKVIPEAVMAGKTVVILGSGDPTIYSPHTGFLKEFSSLDPIVIPGISSFNAANAALTRGVTDGVVSRSVILTVASNAGHGYQGLDTVAKLAETRSTMVIFAMGLDLPVLIDQLGAHYPPDTPVAVVLHAGYQDREKVVISTLNSILKDTEGEQLPFENLIYIGDFLK